MGRAQPDGSGTETIFAANHGAGGDGGRGGDATARIADAEIALGALGDVVAILAVARPGAGGFVTTIEASPAGAAGAAGAGGAARIEVTGNAVSLGDGADTLTLTLQAQQDGGALLDFAPGGAATLLFAGNAFAGDAGTDTPDLRELRGISVRVDLAAGTLGFGDAPAGGTLAGFELIRGTRAGDVFTDGAGNQTYSGYDSGLGATAGPDRYVVAPGGGQDVIGSAIRAQDRIELRGFGAALDTASEALARYDAVAGVLDLGGGDSLPLSGAVTADSFLFS